MTNGNEVFLTQDVLQFMIELYKKENRIAKLEDIMQKFQIARFRTQTILKILISQGYLSLNYNKYSFSTEIWNKLRGVPKIEEKPVEETKPPEEKKAIQSEPTRLGIMGFVEKYTKPIICLTVFIMEIWVVFILFTNFPGQDLAIGYWVLAAIVVTLYHLYVIMDIKRIKKNTGKYSVGYWFLYAMVLIGFLTGALAFNLKAIGAKTQVEDYNALNIQSIVKEIKGNLSTIDKYQTIVDSSDKNWEILKYRTLINDLTATNQLLNDKLPKKQEETKVNSFQLIANSLHIDYNLFMFFFLAWVWAMCEVSLFKTAPALPDWIAGKKE